MEDEDGEPFGAQDSWAYRRVQLAQWFGWRLEDIDRMSASDVRDVFAVIAAQRTFNPKANWWLR